VARLGATLGDPGEHLEAAARDPDGMQSGHRLHAPRLHYLELSDHRIAVHRLGEPEDPVRHGKDGIPQLLFIVFPDQEGGDLPGRQMQRQPLHEVVEAAVRTFRAVRAGERAERVDHDDARTEPPDFLDDPSEHPVQVAGQHFLAEVQEVHV